jgi:hypothetical protein
MFGTESYECDAVDNYRRRWWGKKWTVWVYKSMNRDRYYWFDLTWEYMDFFHVYCAIRLGRLGFSIGRYEDR